MSSKVIKRENSLVSNKGALSGMPSASMDNPGDDLQLRTLPKTADIKSSGFGISEELVDHLNEQICGLKNECARLYNLLREKDVELKRMKKFNEEAETVGVTGITNEVVAVKIVELSKRVRELTSEVESERSKGKQALKQVRELEQVNKVLSNKAPEQAVASVVTAPGDEEKLELELKAANERARLAEGRIADLRNQLEEARRESRLAVRVLTQEVGDGVDVHALLRSEGQAGWKGRAQQLQILQKKFADLKAQMGTGSVSGDVVSLRQAIATADASDFDSIVMATGDLSSTRQSTATNKQLDTLRRLEKERRADQDRLLSEKQALERDFEDTKQRLAASKARNKTLQEDVKSLRERVEQLIEKSRHDDQFVTSLLKQQEALRQSVLAPQTRQVNSASSDVGKPNSNSAKLKPLVQSDQRTLELEATVARLQKELEESRAALMAARNSSTVSDGGAPPLQADCEVVELRGLLQASNMECSRLTESIRTLHDQMDKMTEERLALDAELAANRRDHALLEKQIGKLKLDLDKATGRGGEQATQRHRAEVSLTELEDLRAKVEVLTEERASYRLALERSAQQRKAELSLFENLLDETKRIFSQSVRQLARRTITTSGMDSFSGVNPSELQQ